MTVRFDSNVANDLAWTWDAGSPHHRQYRQGRYGQLRRHQQFRQADHRHGGVQRVARKGRRLFHKIECFCFTEQTLQPGRTVDMPIVFFVDPELDDNQELDTIKEITLSYTFYASDNEGS